jgi:UDP-glucose 4-epimerase
MTETGAKKTQRLKLLVVGGAGFMGSVVVAHLNEAGHDVTICDNLSTGNAWAVQSEARFVPVDITDQGSLMVVLGGDYDAVLNLSGLSLADDSRDHPLRYLRSNVVGTLNLLEAMGAHGLKRLVNSSTAAVYGRPDQIPVTEAHPTRPSNPYAAAKLFVEQTIGFQVAATGLGAVSLRSFNVAGASGPLGEWHHPETHLIPAALQVAAGIRGTVPVYGSAHPTPDGTAVRDYVHVADVARAYVAALEATAEPGHRVYNVGSGVGHSVREVIEVVRSVTGRAIPTVDAPSRDREPAELVASIVRAEEELGWVPARPDLTTIVEDAWTWLRSHLGTTTPRRTTPGVAA